MAAKPQAFQSETMNLNQAILPEFDHEMANTRKTLERVPDDKLAWKPHEKSMTLGRLAELVARLPSWPVFMIKQDELELTTYKSPPLRTSRELVQALDEGVAIAAHALLVKNKQVARGAKAILDAFVTRGLHDLGRHAVPSRGTPLHRVKWCNLHRMIRRVCRGAFLQQSTLVSDAFIPSVVWPGAPVQRQQHVGLG
jgi:hypothetical protein